MNKKNSLQSSPSLTHHLLSQVGNGGKASHGIGIGGYMNFEAIEEEEEEKQCSKGHALEMHKKVP